MLIHELNTLNKGDNIMEVTLNKGDNIMEVKIKAIRFDMTETLEAFVQKKVAKIEKAYDEISDIEVQLKVVKPATAMNKETSITVSVPGTSIFAQKTFDTFEEGVDQCVDSIRVQLTKYKEKSRDY